MHDSSGHRSRPWTTNACSTMRHRLANRRCGASRSKPFTGSTFSNRPCIDSIQRRATIATGCCPMRSAALRSAPMARARSWACVVASMSCSLGRGALRELAQAPFDPALFRFNEGGCDRTGRFWLGVMFDPKDPPQEIGESQGRMAFLYRVRRSCARTAILRSSRTVLRGIEAIAPCTFLIRTAESSTRFDYDADKRPPGGTAHFRDHSARDRASLTAAQ